LRSPGRPGAPSLPVMPVQPCWTARRRTARGAPNPGAGGHLGLRGALPDRAASSRCGHFPAHGHLSLRPRSGSLVTCARAGLLRADPVRRESPARPRLGWAPLAPAPCCRFSRTPEPA
jgi:hypothetical protein